MTTQASDSITSSVPVGVHSADAIPAEVTETAERLGVAQYLPQVVDLTRQVYGGFSDILVAIDPEIPDDTHIVFRIPVHCSVEEALDMDIEWGWRLRQIIPRCPRVYVPSLDFQP